MILYIFLAYMLLNACITLWASTTFRKDGETLDGFLVFLLMFLGLPYIILCTIIDWMVEESDDQPPKDPTAF